MKRSLTAPIVGLGLGATALGGAAVYGAGARCHEGRVVDSLAQCTSIVGASGAAACATAFGAFSPGAEQLSLSGSAPTAQRAVFLTTRPDAQPTAQAVTRAPGDARWRDSLGQVVSPFRNSCSRSSSSSSSSRTYWSGYGGGSGVNSGYSSTSVSRGGFGSSGSSFSSGG
ncbi:MAG: hypothetical protein ABWZ80_03420 [Beijerinckiaceae bacterium]